MNLTGFRKLSFALIVFTISCIFCAYGVLESSDFVEIVKWVGTAYFLSNTIAKGIKKNGEGK
jgi:hypothetical protein